METQLKVQDIEEVSAVVSSESSKSEEETKSEEDEESEDENSEFDELNKEQEPWPTDDQLDKEMKEHVVSVSEESSTIILGDSGIGTVELSYSFQPDMMNLISDSKISLNDNSYNMSQSSVFQTVDQTLIQYSKDII